MANTRIMICPDRCLHPLPRGEYAFNAISMAQEHIVVDSNCQWLDTLETETIEWPGEGDDIHCSNCTKRAVWIDKPDEERPEGPIADGPIAEKPHPGRRY